MYNIETKFSDQTNGSETSNKEVQQDVETWLGNVEICTHNPALRPLWSNPQFTFKTFQPIHKPVDMNNESESESQYLFYESAPTRKIEVRHNGPIPFREKYVVLSLKKLHDSLYFSANGLEYSSNKNEQIYGDGINIPSAGSEDNLKGIFFCYYYAL
jgi:hypothetical protein